MAEGGQREAELKAGRSKEQTRNSIERRYGEEATGTRPGSIEWIVQPDSRRLVAGHPPPIATLADKAKSDTWQLRQNAVFPLDNFSVPYAQVLGPRTLVQEESAAAPGSCDVPDPVEL